MNKNLVHVVAYTTLTVVLTAGAAQSLSGKNTVDSGDIVDGAVGTVDLGKSAVTSARIKNGSVTGSDVKNGSLSRADVANNALTGAEVKDGSLTGAELADGSVPVAKLSTQPVTGFIEQSKSLEIPLDVSLPARLEDSVACPEETTPVSGSWVQDGGDVNETYFVQTSDRTPSGWAFAFYVPFQSQNGGASIRLTVLCATH